MTTELTDDEILAIACDDAEYNCPGVEGDESDDEPGAVYYAHSEEADVSSILLAFARRVIAKDRERRLDVRSEAAYSGLESVVSAPKMPQSASGDFGSSGNTTS